MQLRSLESVCVCMALTVVPGRIVRMMAELNMNMLSLKQTFVRYVSHEIRHSAY